MLIDYLQKENTFNEIYSKLAKPGQIVYGLTNSAKSFMLANLLARSNKSIVFVVNNHHEAQIYQQEIKNLSTKEVFYLPCQEVSPYDQINSDLDVIARQYSVFEQWQNPNKISLTVISFKALLQLYISKEILEEQSFEITSEGEHSPQNIAHRLVEMGYSRNTMVENRAQFSLRGDILDIYPIVGSPMRIEFFGDSIESIREFNTVSQRSTKSDKKQKLKLHPRYLIQRQESDGLENKIKASLKEHLNSVSIETQENIENLIQNSLEQDLLYWEGVEYYRELLNQGSSNLFDYLPQDVHFVFDEWEELTRHTEQWQKQIEEQYQEGLKSGKLIPCQGLHYKQEQIKSQLENFPQKLYLQTMIDDAGVEITCYPTERFASKVEAFITYIRGQLRDQNQVVIYSEQPQRVLGILKEWDVAAIYNNEEVTEQNLDKYKNTAWIQRDGVEEGFKIPELKLIILTDRELFGRSRQAIAKQKNAKSAGPSGQSVLSNIAELKVDDYVVHYKHGIGQYRGTEFITLGPSLGPISGSSKDTENKTRPGALVQEYLAIEYANEARVLIPVDQVHLLSRFRVTDEAKPRLSKLGGMEWERVKKKVKKSVKKIAQDLINLYAARSKQTGYKYPMDTPWQIEMEDAFPYSETDDQITAINALKADMESDKLLDRLICGDAGFGKTEVVIRAVFKAVMDGKQVAILVPTTVLAQQHFNVFQDRYAPYPIRTGLLCRFKTAKEQKETVKKLKEGECDVVIGTHRLLQKDIQFKNLALLVIDEEQRFGVAHKEKLKAARKDLDVISMSATPIPRTLHMSLSGIKDISLISTPPVNRLPIKTYVGEYKQSVIRNAILHELERGGQIFFLHNRVETIDRIAFEIQELVPEAQVRVAHGQMQDRELEDVMFSFINHEFEVLVCTTIIETGLDISNANTIIIDNANNFGLSQLYQLRGRVGRSNVQAYAYLLYHPEHEITETARKRLKAIKELTNLGAGYQVALRDMEIRGVGNVFGAEQHGHMLAVGFDLYCKILSDTIEEMKGNISELELSNECSIDIKVSAFFPERWIEEAKQRIGEYQRLANARTEDTINALCEEWSDRFGRLPQETKNLVEIARIKLLAKSADISSINQEGDFLKITVPKIRLQQWLPIQRSLDNFLQSRSNFKPGTYGSRTAQSCISIRISGMESDTILETLKEIILKLKQVKNEQ